VEAGVNLAVLAERSVEAFGEYDALFFENRVITNSDQLRGAHRFAGALVTLGIVPGDRVAVMMPNCPEVYHAYGGITAAGGVVVPIVFLLAPLEINHILADCTPRILVAGPELVAMAQAATTGLPEPPTIVVTGSDAPKGTLALDDLTDGESEEFEPVAR
jgi:long-chain acyl-CoA synthetase